MQDDFTQVQTKIPINYNLVVVVRTRQSLIQHPRQYMNEEYGLKDERATSPHDV